MHSVKIKLSAVLLISIAGVINAFSQSPLPDSPAIELKADHLLAKLSTEEKIRLIGGVDTFFTEAAPTIGLPRFRMADGPLGVRNWGPSTAYPAGIALAATWDTNLALRVGESLGYDARARGVHFLLGPGVNIYRSPRNGRNMEYFGEDPLLAGRIAVGYVRGVQSKGVSATVKHFAANNVETDRSAYNSVIDERTLNEIYLPAFEAAVKEGDAGAVMNSYNLINGEHATQNRVLNIDILKQRWGFKGILMSDWEATHDGVAAANAGLDLEMPGAKYMNAGTLLPALKSGVLSQAALDDKVRRILRTAIRFGWLDRDQYDLSIPLLSPASSKVALEEAEESITLLKNSGHVLPLNPADGHTYVVLGPNAAATGIQGGGSSRVGSFFVDSIVTGMSNAAGGQAKVYYLQGLPTTDRLFLDTKFDSGTCEVFAGDTTSGTPLRTESSVSQLRFWRENNSYPNDPPRAPGDRGRTYVWKMRYVPSFTGRYVLVSAEWNGDKSVVKLDGTEVFRQTPHEGSAIPLHQTISLRKGKPIEIDVEYFTPGTAPRFGLGLIAVDALFTPAEQKLIQSADAAVVAVGTNFMYESEGYDRSFGLPWGQDELIESVASLNPHTVVDVVAGGAVDAHAWIDRVSALTDSWFGGQSAGEALARVLFGQSPGGKLPMSWEREEQDNPTFNNFFETSGPDKKILYSEGLFYGYRYYTSKHKEPLFPFGFGLSYTTFEMSNLKLTQAADPEGRLLVDFDIRNTGNVRGSEVAQVYVGEPEASVPRPVKELKAFAKVDLAPGASQHVSLKLDRRAFSYYDVSKHDWKMDAGRFDITVGNSSEDNRLVGSVNMQP